MAGNIDADGVAAFLSRPISKRRRRLQFYNFLEVLAEEENHGRHVVGEGTRRLQLLTDAAVCVLFLKAFPVQFLVHSRCQEVRRSTRRCLAGALNTLCFRERAHHFLKVGPSGRAEASGEAQAQVDTRSKSTAKRLQVWKLAIAIAVLEFTELYVSHSEAIG